MGTITGVKYQEMPQELCELQRGRDGGRERGETGKNRKDDGRLKYQQRFGTLAKPSQIRASLVTNPRYGFILRNVHRLGDCVPVGPEVQKKTPVQKIPGGIAGCFMSSRP